MKVAVASADERNVGDLVVFVHIKSNAARANALVVPLGVDEGDDLFELCDINGIVVIKELDGSLEDDYLNLVRLSRHPSLGFVDFICGRDSAASEAEKMQRLRPDLEFSMHNLAPKYPSAKASATVRTLKEHLRGGERNLFSKAATDLMGGGVIEILSDISKDYFYPASLSDFAYLSGVCAAEGVISKLSLTRLPSGSGRAVYSSLNDDSMLISGASVDFSVRRKPLHYMVERVFSPLGVFAEREDYTVGFYVSNERRLAFVGELEFRITDNKNKIIYREITDCQVAKNSSKKLFTKDLREYIEGHEREYYLEYFIKEGIAVASRGTLMFTSPKEFSYLDPHIRADVSGHDKRYSITLSSEAYAKCVELSFEDADAVFHENYFDLSQNAPYKISFTLTSGEDSALALLRSLRVRSMYDMTKDI